MRRPSSVLSWLLTCLVALALATACGGSTGSGSDRDLTDQESDEAGWENDGSDHDTVEPEAEIQEPPVEEVEEPAELTDDEPTPEESDAADIDLWEPPVDDDSAVDQPVEEEPDLADLEPETGEEEEESLGPISCRGFNDCPGDLICDMSEGRCAQRATFIEHTLQIYSFHPRAGAPGDVLVVDGNGFNILWIYLTIGFNSYSAVSALQADENRLLWSVLPGVTGLVGVMLNGLPALLNESFTTAPTGTIACDDTTPAATFEPGATLLDAGPYAAGYLDIEPLQSRLFYPAQCGGIRRPPVSGTFPLVVILHGNGALFLNYEYLAQMLATWGFVSVMVATDHNNTYDPEVVRVIYEMVGRVRDQELSGISPVLQGVRTTAELAFVGHSRGCARTQNTCTDHPELAAHVVATIFLGPADEEPVVPGMFLVLGAANDRQSFPSNFNNSYARQGPPKWKVWLPGGNHSLFSDHKVYPVFDGVPTITRRQQFSVVLKFALPLLQRAFGLAEPFAAQLDATPISPLYTVEMQQE